MTGAPALTSILGSPIDEPGFAAVVAEQARQSESSRLPVWIARGVAGVFGLIGLG